MSAANVLLHVPAGQLVQMVDAFELHLPATQSVHTVCDVAAETELHLPARQSVHAVEAVVEAHFPGTQLTHTVEEVAPMTELH